MWPPEILALAENVLAEARANGLKLATAESCTGGLVAGALTAIGGSSDVFERGFVTYSNDAKIEDLDVPEETIRLHGAVSEPVVRAMAEGALDYSNADVSVAITGIAGPGGGTAEKPVGLVHFAAAREGRETITVAHFFGDIGRAEVRMASIEVALNLLRRQVA
ncbi:MAG: CinA family protein [Micropepsaceae bacterium]